MAKDKNVRIRVSASVLADMQNRLDQMTAQLKDMHNQQRQGIMDAAKLAPAAEPVFFPPVVAADAFTFDVGSDGQAILAFGHKLFPENTGGQIVQRNLVNVSMSLAGMKRLALWLYGFLDAHEKMHGAIPVDEIGIPIPERLQPMVHSRVSMVLRTTADLANDLRR
ncbi:MAG: hypothetical protein HC889_00550 [Synechococcaceae cyanobacterium SM1_2_3]|nr:hypothetical protein [Synechococcaceae cyanobacterium SM1_2_3]